MIKQIQSITEQYIQFTLEEIESFGWKEGQKFDMEVEGESIILTPWKSIDINLKEFSREELEKLILESCNRDVSVGDIIREALTRELNENTETL